VATRTDGTRAIDATTGRVRVATARTTQAVVMEATDGSRARGKRPDTRLPDPADPSVNADTGARRRTFAAESAGRLAITSEPMAAR
jgi:hypothetical protein